MEKLTKKEFKNSLDLTSDQLENHIPELLSGLWKLGSMPEYISEIVSRNGLGKYKKYIDLGCGKGAVLVELAKQFDIIAIGVDIVPDFIKEANTYASKYNLSGKITFKTENIIETLKTTTKQDVVIYGYDSEILGDLYNTLEQLKNCIRKDGYIILEFMFAVQVSQDMLTAKEMADIIEQTGFKIIDRIDWDRERLKQTNKHNTEVIKENVKRLNFCFPDKKELFNEYLQNQMDECEELESKYICTTLLLRQKSYCA